MAGGATWEYVLAQASDLTPIGPLAARDRSLTLEINRGGSTKFHCYDDDEYSQRIEKRKTAIIAKRNGAPKWSGQVLTTDYQASTGKISVGAVGWQKILDTRYFRPGIHQGSAVTYTDIDDGLIIHNLIDKANEQMPEMTGAPSSTFITKGTRETGTPRTRKYEAWQSFGEEINNLTDVENGVDVYVDPMTREMHVVHPLGEFKEKLVFGYNSGPSNLKDVNILEDGGRQFNRETLLGKTNVVYTQDTANIEEYGLLENIDNLSDVNDLTILGAYANEQLAVHLQYKVYEIYPKKWYDSIDNTSPEPLEDYNLGDIGTFSMRTPRVNIEEQPIRIFGMTIDIDNEGNEDVGKITTNLAP